LWANSPHSSITIRQKDKENLLTGAAIETSILIGCAGLSGEQWPCQPSTSPFLRQNSIERSRTVKLHAFCVKITHGRVMSSERSGGQAIIACHERVKVASHGADYGSLINYA
jgi:hypothetical protein